MSTLELSFTVRKRGQQLRELVAITEDFGSILRTCIIQSQTHKYILGFPNPVSVIHRHQAHKGYMHIHVCTYSYAEN